MYIGNSPAGVGNYQVVDDISSTFNGTLTSFALTAATQTINPAKSGQLLVSINGVLQEPDDTGTEGFKVSGSNIVFSSAPATGSTFWAVFQGQNVDIGTPSDNTVGNAQVADDALSGNKIDGGTISNFTSTGIDDNATSTKLTISDTNTLVSGTAANIEALKVNDGTYGLDLGMTATGAYIGTTNVNHTLDIKAYGGATTSTIRLHTNNIERFNIANNGNISFYEDTGTTPKFFWDASAESLGIGTSSPSSKLDIQQATAGNIVSAVFDNTDYTANNRNAIKIRQQVNSSGSYSAYLGVDKNTNNLFLSNDSITANHLVINSAGNVGIGTDAPSTRLEVSDINGAVLRLTRDDADNSVLPDDLLGSVEFYNKDNDGNYVSAFVKAIATETYGRYGALVFGTTGTISTPAIERMRIDHAGTVKITGSLAPSVDITQDLGSAGVRWANIYTGDLHLSNENSEPNEVDGTNGNWTIQEGDENLYIKNNKTGKKYKFSLEEIA